MGAEEWRGGRGVLVVLLYGEFDMLSLLGEFQYNRLSILSHQGASDVQSSDH